MLVPAPRMTLKRVLSPWPSPRKHQAGPLVPDENGSWVLSDKQHGTHSSACVSPANAAAHRAKHFAEYHHLVTFPSEPVIQAFPFCLWENRGSDSQAERQVRGRQSEAFNPDLPDCKAPCFSLCEKR